MSSELDSVDIYTAVIEDHIGSEISFMKWETDLQQSILKKVTSSFMLAVS